jgi:hypothetical protein
MGTSNKKTDFGKMKGKMPASRDGHSAVVVKEQLVVYGGDRHRMPFSDTFVFDLKSCFNSIAN